MARELYIPGSLMSLDIDQVADLWTPGGDIFYPSNNNITTVAGHSVLDVRGQSGAASMTVRGIVIESSGFSEHIETVEPNGLGIVELERQFWRTYLGRIVESGVAETNVDDIDILHPGQLLAEIPALQGRTLMAAYTVPAHEGRGMHLTGWHFNASKGGSAASVECTLYARGPGKAWESVDRQGVSTSGSGPFKVRWGRGVHYMEPGSDIRIRITGNGGQGTAIHGGFWLEI